MQKCPFCGNQSLSQMKPPENATSFVLTAIDRRPNPPAFKATSGLPVDVTVCSVCKKVYLQLSED